MKNQWPFWLFVVGIIVVVAISMSYQGRRNTVSLGDIFPEEDEALDYEYVSGPASLEEEDASGSSDETAAVAPQAESPQNLATPAEPARSADVQPVTATPSSSVASVSVAAESKAGVYTIQILSSKDQTAAQQALKKAKERGLTGAYLYPADLGAKGIWYRIYVGSFQTKAQADQALAAMDQSRYAGAFIQKLK